MFWTMTQSEVLLEPAPDAFVGMDHKERAIALVDRDAEGLFRGGRHEVSVGASRIDAGDAVLGHGGA
jgi:hypothetical protein